MTINFSTGVQGFTTEQLSLTRNGVDVSLAGATLSSADGKTYVTSYTYDGASKRVASITQSDGSSISFTYEPIGATSTYRLKTYTDGEGKTTTLTYTQSATSVTAHPNPSSLSTVGPAYNLNTGELVAALLTPLPPVFGDTNCDRLVNIDDLVAVITAWGTSPAPIPFSGSPDVNSDGIVNIDDLVDVITHWSM